MKFTWFRMIDLKRWEEFEESLLQMFSELSEETQLKEVESKKSLSTMFKTE